MATLSSSSSVSSTPDPTAKPTQVAGLFDSIGLDFLKTDKEKLQEHYEQLGFNLRVKYLQATLSANPLEKNLQIIRFGAEGKRLWEEAKSVGCLDNFKAGVVRGSDLIKDQFNDQQAQSGRSERMSFKKPWQPLDKPIVQ